MCESQSLSNLFGQILRTVLSRQRSQNWARPGPRVLRPRQDQGHGKEYSASTRSIFRICFYLFSQILFSINASYCCDIKRVPPGEERSNRSLKVVTPPTPNSFPWALCTDGRLGSHASRTWRNIPRSGYPDSHRRGSSRRADLHVLQ